MQEVDSLSSVLWWAFPLTVICAAVCIVEGLEFAWMGSALSRRRSALVKDPQLAEFLAQVKPRPYRVYAACWIAAGVLLLLAAFMLRP
jgi:hypothetical protein